MRTVAKSKIPISFVVGIDPGTGLKSNLGLSVFDTKTRDIVLAQELPALWGKSNAMHRIASIVDQFQEIIIPQFSTPDVLFCVESFVMRGKGGETLQRLIGAILSAVPIHCRIHEIQNSTVKLDSAGHGAADKKSVATGMADFFIRNSHAHKCIMKLILEEKWDILDSLAIGVSGYEETIGTLK